MIHLAQVGARRPLAILTAVLVAFIALGITIAVFRAADKEDASPSKSASASRSIAPATGAANLGEAPHSAAYPQHYQQRIEERVRTLAEELRKDRDKYQQALDEQQRAAQARLDQMTNEALQQLRASQRTSPAESQASPGASNAAQEVPNDVRRATPTPIHSMEESDPSASGPFLGSSAEARRGAGQSTRLDESERPQAKANEPFVIPESGFVQGRLLNGVVAKHTGEFVYTHIKLAGRYTSANHHTQDLDSCIVLGEAYAAIAEGRIKVKPIKLVCTLPSGRTRTWKTSGYVVDATDGIEGIAATLVNNQERRVLAVAGAAALERIGTVVTQRETTQAYSPTTGQATSVLTGQAARAFGGGALDGLGRGLQQEVREYFDLFKPTAQIGGGGLLTVFLHTESELPEGGEVLSTVRSTNKGASK